MIESALDSMVTWIFDQLYAAISPLRRLVHHLQVSALEVEFQNLALPISENMRTLVYASYAVLVVTGGILVMTHQTIQTRFSAQVVVPRLFIGLLVAGTWTYIVRQIRNATNDIARALTDDDQYELGERCVEWDVDDETECLEWAPSYRSRFIRGIVGVKPEEPTLADIFALVVGAIILLIVLICWILRNLTFFFLCAFAPVALACHALPSTERFAILWWRLLGACVASSIGQAALMYVYQELEDVEHMIPPDLTGPFRVHQIYAIFLGWMMWLLHKNVFRLARGHQAQIPGSSLVKGMLVSKLASNQFGSRRRRHPRTATSRDGYKPDSRRVGNVRFSEDNSFPFSDRSRAESGYASEGLEPVSRGRSYDSSNTDSPIVFDSAGGDVDEVPTSNSRRDRRRNKRRRRNGGSGPSSSSTPDGFNVNSHQPTGSLGPSVSGTNADSAGPDSGGHAPGDRTDAGGPEGSDPVRSNDTASNRSNPIGDGPSGSDRSPSPSLDYEPPRCFDLNCDSPEHVSGKGNPSFHVPEPVRPTRPPHSSNAPTPENSGSSDGGRSGTGGTDIHSDLSGGERVIDDVDHQRNEPRPGNDSEGGR